MAAKGQSGGGGGYGGGGMRGGGSSGRSGKAKSNVIKITTKKPMSAAEQKARAGLDRVKKSPAAKDVKNRNLNNLKKTYAKSPAKPKVTRKNSSPFGPVAAGIVKPLKAAQPAKNPARVTTRGKVVGTAAGAAAVVGTTKGMKKAGEMNAARIRKNKSKSEPVPRNPRKQ